MEWINQCIIDFWITVIWNASMNLQMNPKIIYATASFTLPNCFRFIIVHNSVLCCRWLPKSRRDTFNYALNHPWNPPNRQFLYMVLAISDWNFFFPLREMHLCFLNSFAYRLKIYLFSIRSVMTPKFLPNIWNPTENCNVWRIKPHLTGGIFVED